MTQQKPQSPIAKAHQEGIKLFDEREFLVTKTGGGRQFEKDENYLTVNNEIKSFLTTYGINLLKAAKEAGMREQLAEIEHKQWIAWSKNIAETENITFARFKRWKLLWRPYSELTEDEKDQDREWGDKALSSFHSAIDEGIEGIKNN